jgi:P-type Ca2+ transporter type 2C
MKSWYQKTVDEILDEKKISLLGLKEEEVLRIREEVGENSLTESKKKSTLQVFIEQFKDLLVVILIAAALISMFSGHVESTIVIISVIIINALLGTIQHVKAEKSLESLKRLSSPNARVMRDGKQLEITASDVVPGDILLLEAGDLVAADGRIFKNFSLQVNESSLTGESTNVDKNELVITEDEGLGDRVNMVYAGSLVTYGRAEVIVTETGMSTEIGKIAGLMNQTAEKKTPLQISLDDFSKKLAFIIMIISAFVFALSVYRDMPLLDAMMFAVALAVAAIPEALGSIVTIVQAIGTQKMASQQAIIKDLKAVESLGSVSVVCSDKTGTLTQNKMSVQQVYIDDKTFHFTEIDLKNQLHRYLLYDAILTNNASFQNGVAIGDPTEYALLEMAQKIQLQDDEIRDMMPRLEELPFDSDRKLMSTLYRLRGIPTILTKGALDVLLDRTIQIRTSDGIRDITEEDKHRILEQNRKFSENGLRVLAFGYREVGEEDTLTYELEQDFIFLGLISMIDPPREESKAAVADAKRAGIRTIMITGDHKITAVAIAKEIGIFEEGDEAYTGAELDALAEEELDQKLEHISVYARVSPENKIRIVTAWQRRGNIVAMTGDGVNDAPALKKADIGVAMGITGTEVSKDAAGMILSDDNFATIIKAVANGRNVYRNIQNAIQFLLSGNTAGILTVLYTSIMALPVPFLPVHLLFINLLTDSLPAIAIGMEPADGNLLEKKPRDPKAGILSGNFLWKVLFQGLLITISTVIAFYIGYNTGSALLASTMAFATLTMSRLFHGFNCRSEQSIFKLGFKNNMYSLYAFILGTILLNLLLFVPVLQRVFSVGKLNVTQIGWIYLLAFIPTALIQMGKIIRNILKKKNIK